MTHRFSTHSARSCHAYHPVFRLDLVIQMLSCKRPIRTVQTIGYNDSLAPCVCSTHSVRSYQSHYRFNRLIALPQSLLVADSFLRLALSSTTARSRISDPPHMRLTRLRHMLLMFDSFCQFRSLSLNQLTLVHDRYSSRPELVEDHSDSSDSR